VQVLPARLSVAVPLGMGAHGLRHSIVILWALGIPTACKQPCSMAARQLMLCLWLVHAQRIHVQ
jgi:hypothetical protein